MNERMTNLNKEQTMVNAIEEKRTEYTGRIHARDCRWLEALMRASLGDKSRASQTQFS